MTFPGIVTSMSSSATISTKGMSPGGEIWANWFSLPPGKAVEEPASPPNLGKWAVLGMGLSGTSVELGDPAPVGMCHGFSAGQRADPNAPAGQEFIAHPGDMYACNYTLFPRSRHENRGSEPNTFAGLAVGGPWVPGMVDTPGLYREAGGVGLALPFPRLAQWRRKSSTQAR